MALEITNLRFLDRLRGGRAPGAEVSMLKITGTEIQQALTELDDAGRRTRSRSREDRSTKATPSTRSPHRSPQRYCNYRKTSIYAGSNEIQRNIIAKRLLDL